MKTEKETQPTPAQIVAGGETVPTAAGDIFVRQVKPSELMRYLSAEAQGEESVLHLVCARVDAAPFDLDACTLAEYESLLEADRRQNFTAARRREQRETDRAARQMEQVKAQAPEVYAKLQAEQSELMASMFSSLVPSRPDAGIGAHAQTA